VTLASYAAEDIVLQTARGLGEEVGIEPVTADTGAVLRLLAGANSARSVVEIGTGTGVSGLWLLRGMRPEGVLTTIDLESEHQRMARRLFAEAGYQAGRTRIITGRALDVLPRLSDGVYDVIFADADVREYESYVDAAARLLHPGGLLILHGVLTRKAAASVAAAVRESDLWAPALIPTGDGLLGAVRL
jgi:predicted O-methyltransferase YrrM